MQANHVLDNPVWHALNSHHAHLAIGTGLGKHYPPEVNGAAALAEHSEAAYRDLAQLVGAGGLLPYLKPIRRKTCPTGR